MGLTNISTDKLQRYYFIISEQDFFQQQAKNEILNKIFNSNIDTSAIINFDFGNDEEEIKIENIMEAIHTVSMFAPVKVVIIKSVEKIKSDDFNEIFEDIEKIPEGIYILFLGSSLPASLRKVKLPEENFFNFKLDNLIFVKKFFNEYLEQNNKKIDNDVLEFIINEANYDMYAVKNELDKLILFTGDEKEIKRDDFNKTRGVEKEYDIWALASLICDNNEKKAFEVFEKIYDNFEPEIILASIFGSIKRIYRVMNLKDKGLSKEEIIEELGKSSYYAFNQIKNFEGVRYVELVDIIKNADKKIKTSNRKDAKIIFNIMLAEIFNKLKSKKQV